MIKNLLGNIGAAIEQFEEKNKNVLAKKNELDALQSIVGELEPTWSKSWIGFHADLYFKDFKKPPTWEYEFDSEWGSINGIHDYWVKKDYNEVTEYVLQRSGGISLENIRKSIDEAIIELKEIQSQISTDLVIIENNKKLENEWALVKEIEVHKWGLNLVDIIEYRQPKQVMTRDSFAMQQGIKTPPHIMYDSEIITEVSRISSIEEFIKKSKKLLRQIELKLNFEIVEGSPADAIDNIIRICMTFHQVARQLRSRHNNRKTIEINDEYDVQDLLHSILKIYFDDIRKEEWSPSYAGGASRMDFLLKKEKIVIEVKKTRKGLNDKELGEQLIIDIAKYKLHPGCKMLICFAYDPEARIGNPTGIEEDLNQMSTEELRVITLIAPK